ncbi:Pectinesterase [Psidium guajava]|nr:Pectinesterase [Psidium guajava]
MPLGTVTAFTLASLVKMSCREATVANTIQENFKAMCKIASAD